MAMKINTAKRQVMLTRAQKLSGQPQIPGDKSISHRALLFGALAHGTTEIENLLESGDVQSTARCLRAMGVEIVRVGAKTLVMGRGTQGLLPSREPLDCGNSGTTIRILMGVLAGLRGMEAQLTGDASLVKRPMKRVAEPLRSMGADIELTSGDLAPVKIVGKQLTGVDYHLKIASAQIKTAIVMAALSAKGTTKISGEIQSRDHTERMLKHFGVSLQVSPSALSIEGGQELKAAPVQVPGDPSTAAFWMGAACLVPGAHIEMEGISLNPTRTGLIGVLEKMGARISSQVTFDGAEPIGRVVINGFDGACQLRGVTLDEEVIPSMIDEIPLLAVLATQAHGRTEVRGAEELRVKETDRIEAVAHNLKAMGAKIETRADGFVIEGPQKLNGALINSFHDHRIAMAFSIASLVADGETTIDGADCVGISYPGFFQTLHELTGE